MWLEHFEDLLAILCRSPHEELAHAETTIFRVYHFCEEFLAAVAGEGQFGQSLSQEQTPRWKDALLEYCPPRLFALFFRGE